MGSDTLYSRTFISQNDLNNASIKHHPPYVARANDRPIWATMSSSKGIAVVTGAGQGIGQGIAVRLADDGFDMVINDIPSNKENLDATAELINSKGRRVLCVFGDVSREEDVQTIIDKTIAEFGSLDVVRS